MNAVLNILRGIVIGIANVIPGVSGGTMAVSMGIYDKLISSVTGLFKHFKQSMKLLIPLGIGMVIGIVGFGFLLEYLLANHVLATCLTFVGLIASATMVIPGVSGSMVLMVLGYYSTILSLVTGTVTMLKDMDFGGVIHNCLLLAPFAVGVVLGIFLIAKIIEYLFQRFPCQTYAAIIGLIVSSPFAILYSADALSGFSVPELIIGLVLAALGAWVTWLMGSKEEG